LPSPERERDDPDLAARARALVLAERTGVLSTLSVHRHGYPYGSVTPYALSCRRQPIILISSLAAHTKNLLADPRACLFVGDQRAADDPQAGARVSLLARAAPVPAEEQADARARYLARVPQAQRYFATHDFSLWELAVEELRLIAGFGKICWMDGAAIRSDPERDPLRAEAAGICGHMNDDHAEALRTFCQAAGVHPAAVRMVGVDVLGFDLETDADRLRFDFPDEVTTPDGVRRAVIARLAQARKTLAETAGTELS
jgi:putative heme iron utilization protein